MNLASEGLLVTFFVGLIAGWLASQFVGGVGFGLLGDLAVGVIGAFVGNILMWFMNIEIGGQLIGLIINATVGAIVVLLIVRVARGGGRLDGGWRRSRAV